MGMVRVCCSIAAVVGVLCERMRSGCSATSSFANRCLDSASPGVAQRVSIRMLRPSAHPSFWSPSRNAATQACPSGSLSANAHQHADPPHPAGLLRARGERPNAHAAPPPRGDEIAPPHRSTCHVLLARRGPAESCRKHSTHRPGGSASAIAPRMRRHVRTARSIACHSVGNAAEHAATHAVAAAARRPTREPSSARYDQRHEIDAARSDRRVVMPVQRLTAMQRERLEGDAAIGHATNARAASNLQPFEHEVPLNIAERQIR